MSTQYPKTWKQCATCAFWCGPREADHWGDRVSVDSSSTYGKCSIPSGGWKGSQRQAGQTCNDWQKWPIWK